MLASQSQVQQGISPGAGTAQPFFENQLTNQLATFGLDCPNTATLFGLAANNCTQLAAQPASSFFPVGDVSTTILQQCEFQDPGNSLNAPNFGINTEQENNPRVLQVALRFEF
jgi:hypothetical protein